MSNYLIAKLESVAVGNVTETSEIRKLIKQARAEIAEQIIATGALCKATADAERAFLCGWEPYSQNAFPISG